MLSWPSYGNSPAVIANTHPLYGVGTALAPIGSTMSSAAWPSANRAIISPLYIPDWFLVKLLWVMNGATASGNIDIGLYRADLTKIVSAGSTAQSGTSQIQTFDIADTLLAPGRYWLAVAKNDATGTTVAWTSTVNQMRTAAVLSAAAHFALPSTLSPDSALASAYLPMAGITNRTTI